MSGPRLLPVLLPALILAAVLVAGCSAAVPAAGTAASGGAGPDRSNADAVATAFATDYASGDTPAACTLAAPALAARLAGQGMCQARAGWDQTYREVARCVNTAGALVTYQVDREVDRFLLFTVQIVPDRAGHWSVAGLIHHSPGEALPTCDSAPGTASTGGS